MQSKTEILQLVHQYQNHFPDEKGRVQAMLSFIEAFEGEQLFHRKNFTGHITASAYILNSSRDALLLLKHKSLNRWLQPGGHIEAYDDTLVEAALREAREETGFTSASLSLVSNNIFDVDSHPIPENLSKREPAHVHHDISLLFVSNTNGIIEIDEEESTEGKWVAVSTLREHKKFDIILKKIDLALS